MLNQPLIFHIRASNFFGGPERQILGHILTSNTFRHRVVTFQEGIQANEFQAVCQGQGVAVTAIKTNHAYQLSGIRQLSECIKSEHPAIICCHGYKPLILSLLARRNLKIPVIAFSRGHTSENLKVRFFEFVERKLYAYVDKIVAVSTGYAQRLQTQGIAESQIAIIHNSINSEKFHDFLSRRNRTRKDLGYHDDDFLVATAGRLSPEKAQGDLIKAFAALPSGEQRVHLLVCGDGPLRDQLEDQVRTSGVENVCFLGHRRDLDILMPGFDLFVLPSLTEGFPNVLLEAAACHVPIVATKVGGVPEIILHGETGQLVEAGSVQQLSGAIAQCMGDKEMSARYAESAHALVLEKYNFTRQASQLEAVFTGMLPGMAQ